MKNAVSKILILVIIAILVAGGFFVWEKWDKGWFAKEERPKLPAGIEVIEQGDKKIVKNTVEGYEMTVSKKWEVGSKTSDRVVLETKINNPASEEVDSVLIVNVFSVGKQDDLNNWLKDRIATLEEPGCYKIENPIQWDKHTVLIVEDACQYGGPIKEYYTKIEANIYSFQDLGGGIDEIKLILRSIIDRR